jgi:hypothetical protein
MLYDEEDMQQLASSYHMIWLIVFSVLCSGCGRAMVTDYGKIATPIVDHEKLPGECRPRPIMVIGLKVPPAVFQEAPDYFTSPELFGRPLTYHLLRELEREMPCYTFLEPAAHTLRLLQKSGILTTGIDITLPVRQELGIPPSEFFVRAEVIGVDQCFPVTQGRCVTTVEVLVIFTHSRTRELVIGASRREEGEGRVLHKKQVPIRPEPCAKDAIKAMDCAIQSALHFAVSDALKKFEQGKGQSTH